MKKLFLIFMILIILIGCEDAFEITKAEDILKVSFVGDSLTAQNKWQEAFPEYEVTNFGHGGDETYEILERIQEIKAVSADVIIFLVGSNDARMRVSIYDYIYYHVRLMIQLRKITPNVYVIKIYPTDDVKRNNFINRYNNWLTNRYDDWFRNCSDDIIDIVTGILRPEYTVDGVHLNGDGYDIIEDAYNLQIFDNL